MDAEIVTDIWFYPLKYGDTLTSNQWIEWDFHSFLTSRFVTYAVHDNRREAAFTSMLLWSESYRQNPAGTLPSDDIELMSLARVASISDWQAMRVRVLWGWQPCEVEGLRSGSRLGHSFIAKIAAQSYQRKAGRAKGREAAEVSQIRFKVRKKLLAIGQKKLADNTAMVDALGKWMTAAKLYVNEDNLRAAMEVVTGIPRVVTGRFGSGGAD